MTNFMKRISKLFNVLKKWMEIVNIFLSLGVTFAGSATESRQSETKDPDSGKKG